MPREQLLGLLEMDSGGVCVLAQEEVKMRASLWQPDLVLKPNPGVSYLLTGTDPMAKEREEVLKSRS